MYWHCGGGGGGRSETGRETRVRNFRREQVLGGITWRHRDSEFAWRHIIDHLLEQNPQQSLVAFVVPYSAHCRIFLGRPSFHPALLHPPSSSPFAEATERWSDTNNKDDNVRDRTRRNRKRTGDNSGADPQDYGTPPCTDGTIIMMMMMSSQC